MSGGEEADWIVARARARGVTITRRQLAEWHRAGLIPRPDQEFVGRPKGGSISVYPVGTLEQALACERWLDRDRNFGRVGWYLWTEGFSVPDDLWRRPFIEAQTMFQKVAGFADSDDAADGEHSSLMTQALQNRSGIVPVVRRQIRGKNREIILSRVLASVFGAFFHSADEESAEQSELFSRLFGMAKEKEKAFRPEDVAINLSDMTDGLSQIASYDLTTLDRAETVRCWQEYNFLLVWMIGHVAQFGTAARVLSNVLETMRASSPTQQAALVLAWMSVRNLPGWRDGLLRLALVDGQKRDSRE